MKTIATAVGASVLAFSAHAGTLAPVEVEPAPIVVESGPASSVSPLLILGLLVLIGVLVSRNQDEENETSSV